MNIITIIVKDVCFPYQIVNSLKAGTWVACNDIHLMNEKLMKTSENNNCFKVIFGVGKQKP